MSNIDAKIVSLSTKFTSNTLKLQGYIEQKFLRPSVSDSTSGWRNSRPSYQPSNPIESQAKPLPHGEGLSAPMRADSIPRKQPGDQGTYNIEPIQNFSNQLGGYSNPPGGAEKRNIYDFNEHFRIGLDKKPTP